MSKIEQQLDRRKKDAGVLIKFVSIFCREKHGDRPKSDFQLKNVDLEQFTPDRISLCNECDKLLGHALTKLSLCPYNPKPKCKNCTTHCYRPEYRRQIRKVMGFVGPYLIKRGHLGMLFHYFF